MTDYMFRCRLCLVIIVVMIAHAQVFFHFSTQIKIQSQQLIPHKVISAALIKKSDTNSLSSLNLKPNDLSTGHVAGSKYVQIDVTNKTNRSNIKETTVAPHVVKNENIRNSAAKRKSTDSSKSAVPIDSTQEKSEGHGKSRSDLDSLGQMPIHLANPQFKHSRPVPVYPQQALRMREEGLVVIRVLISQSGQVTHAIVQQSSGSAWLDSAAKHAALDAQFYPHTIDGVAHRTQADLPFKFVMK